MRSVEICAGAGGLALATTQAGFFPLALLENDPKACATMNENRTRGSQWVKSWPKAEPTDIREFNYSSLDSPIDLLSGGPPCQPFSVAGKHLGIDDDRDLFPEFARAMKHLQPRAILIENTNGLARESFTRQLDYILLQLMFPDCRRKSGEHRTKFSARLKRHAKQSGGDQYTLSCFVLNAADFGVAQQRKRLFIVGLRRANPPFFCPPVPTHSLDSLLYDQWVTGEYWDRHKVPTRERPQLLGRWKSRITRLNESNERPKLLPWRTIRDEISSLPPPFERPDSDEILNHQFQPGARSYPGHSGSEFDLPAKALKAGRHGVPGGENMLRFPSGAVRYFSIRECARLQSFPDDYYFSGCWLHMTRQIGNAVPVLLCRSVAETIKARLDRVELPKVAVVASEGPSQPRQRRAG